MTQPTAESAEQLQREFARFIRRTRRRAAIITLLRCWIPVLALCITAGLAVSAKTNLTPLHSIAAGFALSLPLAAVFIWRRRTWSRNYLAYVDHYYDAAGRILAAAEFVKNNPDLNAFQRLAVEDAAIWIKRKADRGLPWIVNLKRIPSPITALFMPLILLAGCEAPQPIEPRPASEPETPAVYPTSQKARLEQQPKPSGENQGVDSGDYKNQPRTPIVVPADESNRQGEGVGQDKGSIPVPAPGPAPNEAPAPAQPDDKPQDAPPPDLPLPPSIGPGAGRQSGHKQENNEQVEAPEEEIKAREVDDDAPGVGETIEEGEGEDFTEGEPPRPADAQPVPKVDYRDARRQDLTRERVSPARRELIERYFEKLRKARLGASSKPTSRPASQPARKE